MQMDQARPQAPAWLRRVEKLRLLPTWLRLLLIVTSILVIGWLDHMGGRGASFFVFYALPIMLATWLVDRTAGIWIALFSGVVWQVANYGNIPYATPWHMLWVAVGRVTYFVFMAVGTAAMRNKQESDAGHIELLHEMRQLEMELVTAREKEQQRIGQDLHDGLCQQLAAIGCAVRALADDLQSRELPEAADAEKIGKAIQQTVVEARGMAGGMSSLHVERGGLSAALATLAQTTNKLTGVPVRLHASPTIKITDPEIATHLYRIAQEAVGNAVRHSGADEVTVRLEEKGGYVELRIDDTGKGFQEHPDRRMTGIGLQTMRYRAHAVGADFIIHPRPGGGTSVRCTLPLRQIASTHSHANN